MARTFLITSLSLLIVVAFGQTKEQALTQAEQFSLRSGTLIERQFINIGKFKNIEVKVLKLYDLNANVSRSALRFELKSRSAYSSGTKIASLDVDEIDDLIRSIKNLQQNVFSTTRDAYTEVSFKSISGFSAGAYYSPEKGKWEAYLQLEERDSESMVFLLTNEFEALLNLIEKSKATM